MKKKENKFQFLINLILAAVSILCVFPFLLMFMASVTEETALNINGYSLFPTQFDFEAYRYLLADSTVLFNGYKVSIMVTLFGTVLNLILTTLFAYPLSRKNLPGRKFFSFFLFFTMLFNSGLIPSYMMWTKTFHIQNTYAALVVPNLLMGAYNVIMMRTYLSSGVPDEVIEAARIDGASEFVILSRIVIPMAKPIIATLAMLVGLGYWNDWTNGLYYLNDDNLYSVQVLLMKILRNIDMVRVNAAAGGGSLGPLPSMSLRMAIAVMGVIPVLIVYPLMQKYLVKGITVGSVKG